MTVVPPAAAVTNFTLSSWMFCPGRVESDWRNASKSVVPSIMWPVSPPPKPSGPGVTSPASWLNSQIVGVPGATVTLVPLLASRRNGSSTLRMPSSSLSLSPGTIRSAGASTVISLEPISATQSVPSGPVVTSSGLPSGTPRLLLATKKMPSGSSTPSSAVPKMPSAPSVGTGASPVPVSSRFKRVTLSLNCVTNSLPSSTPSKAWPLLS